MNRELLEQPFPKELLKTRKGTFGKQFSYVEGTEYIKRLNDAFESAWSFDVIEHQVLEAEVIVLGQLTAGDVTKTAFGGSRITVNREGEVVSIADDLKAAATDALKKASSLLGVGLHLYSEPTDTTSGRNGRSPSRQGRGNGKSTSNGGNGKPANGNGKSNGNSNGKSNDNGAGVTSGNGRDRLTQRQLSAIWNMGRALGENVDAIRQHCIDAFGVQPEHLTKPDASSFITQMGESLGR